VRNPVRRLAGRVVRLGENPRSCSRFAETTFPVIAHHHDFALERERFTLDAVNEGFRSLAIPLTRSRMASA
jgi:hypothetical protein